MRFKAIAMIAGVVLLMTAPAWATSFNYSFENCGQISSTLGAGGACPGNLKTSGATYTAGGTSITAVGYQAGIGTTNLYVKKDGGDESGLGIANESDHEIADNQIIQLNLTNLALAGITSGNLALGSVQTGEGYAIFTSNQAGTLGSLELTGTLDDTGFPVTWTQSDPFIGITAVDPNSSCDWNCGTNYHSDVLLVSLSASTPTSPTPEPASLALMGTGLLAIAFAVRKRFSLAKQN
ncbi:MAG: PEP-CTERM sorting domain-containing protein [Terriglobia bacterium]